MDVTLGKRPLPFEIIDISFSCEDIEHVSGPTVKCDQPTSMCCYVNTLRLHNQKKTLLIQIYEDPRKHSHCSLPVEDLAEVEIDGP